jgi:hypothetical protein
MARKINFNYLNRDYATLKTDLQSFVKLYYPDQYNDFSESSVGMMMLEMNAYVGDILSYHVDQSFNEMFIDSAQNRDSVLRIAKNLGYKTRGRSPSAVLLDVTIEVPTLGDGYDENYMLTFQKGASVRSSSGQIFEIIDPVEFSEHRSATGIANRVIDPVYNESNEIINYRITKTVPAIAGESKVTSLEITSANSIPFLKWYPEEGDFDITEIMDIVSSDTRFPPDNEADWSDAGSYNVWYKVDTLPQERVFIDNTTVGDVAEGYWKYVEKRYETEWDKNGNHFVTFGAGIEDYNSYDDFLLNGMSGLTVATILNNDSYGEIPSVGLYMHCRYRSGGGSKTNASVGSIDTVVSKVVSYIPGGAGLPAIKVSDVINSISVSNPIPAIGGSEFETINEIKANSRKHFSSQDRCVTVDDYISRVAQMPATYGRVFRSYAEADPDSMNTKLYVLTRDETGKLKNSGNEQIKLNIASYLKNYKVLNDFIEIVDGRIINLGIRFAVQVSREHNRKDVIANCIQVLAQKFTLENWEMNSVIYVSEVTDLLMDQPGVVNVASLQFYNKAGDDYSTDVISYGISGPRLETAVTLAREGEIEIVPINNKILSSSTSMFEIKYPEVDIKGAAL